MGQGDVMQKSFIAVALAAGLLFAGSASAQIKIGFHAPQSGPAAADGKSSTVGAEIARDWINEKGGVLGQKIEVITADHQNKPDLAAAIARRWYDAEGVDMITELTTSSVALAVQELSKEKKKIDIVVGAATSRISGDACTPLANTEAIRSGTHLRSDLLQAARGRNALTADDEEDTS